MDSILDELKSRTSALHEQVEKRLNLPARLASVETFQQLLAAFYGFYAPVEARLVEALKFEPVGIDFTARQKSTLIVADLNCWNIPVAELPLCRDLPTINSSASAFGCMYVLEGATLGGQIIKRLLAEKLSIVSSNGGSFFTAYGDRVRDMWNEFREHLTDYSIAHPDHRETIIASAAETFTKLEHWLGQQLP